MGPDKKGVNKVNHQHASYWRWMQHAHYDMPYENLVADPRRVMREVASLFTRRDLTPVVIDLLLNATNAHFHTDVNDRDRRREGGGQMVNHAGSLNVTGAHTMMFNNGVIQKIQDTFCCWQHHHGYE